LNKNLKEVKGHSLKKEHSWKKDQQRQRLRDGNNMPSMFGGHKQSVAREQ
jgi:hypothetical protein